MISRFLYCIRLFTECAEAKVLFGFPITMDPSSKELLLSKRVVAHAAYLIKMIDSVLNMLGPDTEVLTEIMAELSKKHVRMGITPDMFRSMGKCLIGMLEECLAEYQSGFRFTQTIKDAWVETYAVLSSGMLQAYEDK